MQDFPSGIRLGENEDEYQLALHQYRGGLVLGFTKSRDGVRTVHRPDCLTISYDLKRAGHTKRSRKILFHDRAELDNWYSHNRSVGRLRHGCHECS
jgi:hypothetical protein